MFVIYSFNSLNGKVTPGAFDLDLANYAVTTMKKVTGMDCVFYTDKHGAQAFRDVPFSDIKIIEFPYINDTFWNIGKLYVYSLQNNPFVHVDLDIVIRNGFSFPDTDIICEFKRNIAHDENTLKYSYPQYEEPNWIYCSGIMGGNNYGNVFKDNFNYAMKTIESGETALFEHLFSIEEVAFTQLVDYNELTVGSPNPVTFVHMQGKNKEARYCNLLEQLKLERFNIRF